MLTGTIELRLDFILNNKEGNPTPHEVRKAADLFACQMEALNLSEWKATCHIKNGIFTYTYMKENILSIGAFQVELNALEADGLDQKIIKCILYDDSNHQIWDSASKKITEEGLKFV